MLVNRRISVDENDPGYCPFILCDEVKIYLKDDREGKADLYFTTVDPAKREAIVIVFDMQGKKVGHNGNLLTALLTDVDIVVETDEETAKDIEYWFATEDKSE
jgi:hypothetical protein